MVTIGDVVMFIDVLKQAMHRLASSIYFWLHNFAGQLTAMTKLQGIHACSIFWTK